jgi:hypothetical protein
MRRGCRREESHAAVCSLEDAVLPLHIHRNRMPPVSTTVAAPVALRCRGRILELVPPFS